MLPVLTALLLLVAASAAAHDIPSDVTVQALVKPAGQRMQVLVRVPLRAIRDVVFPEKGNSGYLDLERAAPLLPDAAKLWVGGFLEIHEDGVQLPAPRLAAVRVSLPSDRSFATFEEALAHVAGPALPAGENVVAGQVLFDVLLEYAIRSDRSAFAIRTGLRHFAARVVTALRFLPPGGAVRAFEFTGDPGLMPLDPRWHQAALRFVHLGFLHILDGVDHLLFLACLVIPCRRLRPLAGVVTAFAAAHSVTLIASAFGMAPGALWFPPLIEMLIALSIVYMALENIFVPGGGGQRWRMAFGFGLVHGFGFSFALRETLQFAGSHLLTSLLAFNVGVELGQLLVLLVLVPALTLLFRHAASERTGTLVLCVLIAHTGWHWLTERFEILRQFRFEWPEMDAAFWASAMRWAMVAVLLVGMDWVILRLRRR